jgi:hypothetical protein
MWEIWMYCLVPKMHNKHKLQIVRQKAKSAVFFVAAENAHNKLAGLIWELQYDAKRVFFILLVFFSQESLLKEKINIFVLLCRVFECWKFCFRVKNQ